MSQLLRFTFSFFLILSGYLTVYAAEQDRAEEAFQQGHFQHAIQTWTANYPNLPAAQQITVALKLATAYQAIGDYESSFRLLQQLLKNLPSDYPIEQRGLIINQLSELAYLTQQADLATQYMQQAETIITPENYPNAYAHLLNNQANLAALNKDYQQAEQYYQQALSYVESTSEFKSKLQLNYLQTLLLDKNYSLLIKKLPEIFEEVKRFPAGHHKAFTLLSIGRVAQRVINEKSSYKNELIHFAYTAFKQAREIAQKNNEPHILSLSYGHLGELYENEGSLDTAIQLTRQAIFFAQQESAKASLHRWYWQLGRIFTRQNKIVDALDAYQNTIDVIQPLRDQLTIAYRYSSQSFHESVEPVYFELTDLLLKQAETESNAEKREQLLKQARDTMELLKAAELEDYFQDDCVTAVRATSKGLDALDKHTVVLYPISLPKRLVLLASFPTGMQQFVVDVDSEQYRDTIRLFRHHLTIRTNFRFLRQAKQLYRWLIHPLRNRLVRENIHTLVVVPDGALRTIPLAPLYDGKRFLIEKYALAVTPGLTLTNPQRINKDSNKVNILLNGLSEGVQGFSALPNVKEEIKNISPLYNSKTLVNEEFSIKNVEGALQSTPYSIVHIASHGQFDRDPNKTFLLTYDGKLTMNRLESMLSLSQFRKEAVELLTLSACQTAVGDERAALGLAGVAVKAGARSALASLWFIDDEATALLVTLFYQALSQSHSKAQALQQAQIQVLKKHYFRHPAYWSALLLIGNWL